MILTNATIVTFWPSQPFVDGALLAVEGKTIVDFGKVGKLVDRYEDEETYDVEGRWVVPGLVDPHVVNGRALVRTMPEKGVVPRAYREIHEELWWRLEAALGPEDVYLATAAALLDGVRAGVTTFGLQHQSSATVERSLDAVWQACADVGVRAAVSYAVTDRHGEAHARAAIEENRRFAARARADRNGVMAALMGLEGAELVSDETLAAATAAAGDGARFHVGLAAHADELDDSRRRFRKTPVERLAEAGALSPESVAAHCVYVEPSDHGLLRRSRARVVHCPESEIAHGTRITDLGALRASGIALGIGTAGLGGGLPETLRLASLLQRTLGRDAQEARELVTRAAFHGNARWATAVLGPPIGTIKPGARADLLVLDYEPSTPVSPANLAAHVVEALGRSRLTMVVINGKLVLRDGAFVALDEKRLRARAREAARSLWERL